MINCVITSTVGGYTSLWYEGERYVVNLQMNFGAGATVANAAWWDALDPKMRDFLAAQITTLSAKVWAQNRREDREGIDYNTAGPCSIGTELGNRTLITPTEADFTLQKEAFTKAVLSGWQKRCGDAWETTYKTFVRA